jgi:hypothetical protein
MCTEIKTENSKNSPVQLIRSQPPIIEAQDAAEYLEDILSELRDVAAKSGFKFLAALIEVSIEEARQQAHEARRLKEAV